ncbi:MAG: hypothetical protein AAF581_13390 [Planctomycetota bacterium]
MIRGLRLLGMIGLGVSALTFPSAASAGTVFLKNGYVLQGDIVERHEEGVVMQWPDGRVTIYDRFVTDVIIEPQELAAIERRERLIADQGPVTRAVRPVERRAVLRLPASLDEIMSPDRASVAAEEVVRDPTAVEVPVVEVLDPVAPAPSDPEIAMIPDTPHDSGSDADPATVPDTHVAEIPNPVETAIEEIVPARTAELEFPELGIAFVPPEGWLVLEDAEGVRLRPGSDESFPSLHISVQLHPEDQVQNAGQLLEDVLRARFPGIEVHEVRQQQIGFERGFVVTGELPSRNLTFSQALIPHAGSHYLVGIQQEKPGDEGVERQLQRALHSLRFLTQ